MRLLFVTDAFPPDCGGSGWSTFHLAKALVGAGHKLRVIKPEPGLAGIRRRTYEGISVVDFGFPFRDVPYLRSLLRDELLLRRLRDYLVAEIREEPVDLLHAQHAITAVPSIVAGLSSGVPTVVTVRDYWPICYFTTWHVAGGRCPECSVARMLACMKERNPRAYWAGIPMIPYMRRNVRRKQHWLRKADAVVAVSRYVAAEAVRPIVGDERTHVIPNLIDVDQVDRVTADPPQAALPQRFLLFVGKLNPLKGAGFVLDVVARLNDRIPLVVIGDGPERGAMEQRIRRDGLDVRLLPWLDNAEVWRVMKRATLVLIPSLWAEPLSRTVIEAMASASPIVATDVGGIRDQIEHDHSGLILPPDPEAFARAIADLLGDEPRRRRLGEEAYAQVRRKFHHAIVLPKIESLYSKLAR